MTWEEFHHSTSADRVSGDLPGSFISWSPDNRFVRLVILLLLLLLNFSFLKTSNSPDTLISTNVAFLLVVPLYQNDHKPFAEPARSSLLIDQSFSMLKAKLPRVVRR